MTEPADEGGEAPCSAHLLDAPRSDIRGRADIKVLVVSFYRDVAMDDVLGPVFTAAGVDWPAHIAKLVDFWAWQLFDAPVYERNPLRAHQRVHDRIPFQEHHYRRWLELFASTVDEHFAGTVADLAKRRARKMAAAMRRILDTADAERLGVSRSS